MFACISTTWLKSIDCSCRMHESELDDCYSSNCIANWMNWLFYCILIKCSDFNHIAMIYNNIHFKTIYSSALRTNYNWCVLRSSMLALRVAISLYCSSTGRNLPQGRHNHLEWLPMIASLVAWIFNKVALGWLSIHPMEPLPSSPIGIQPTTAFGIQFKWVLRLVEQLYLMWGISYILSSNQGGNLYWI